MVASHLLDEIDKAIFCVQHGVEVELTQIGAGRPLDEEPAFRSHPIGVVHTLCIERQISSSVSHTYFEAGMTLQDPATDKTGNRYRRFEWMADNIDEIVVPHAFPSSAADGMDKDQHVQFFGLRKQRLEAGIIKVYSVDV